MFDWIYFREAENHRDMLYREAENERLLREALSSKRPNRHSLRREALAALGRRLMAWGEHLQQQYGEIQAGVKPMSLESVQHE